MGRRSSPSSQSGNFSGWLLIPVALTLAALLLPLASVLSPSSQTPDSVPFSMHSVLKADYSAEFGQGLFPAVNVNLIRQAILDQDDQAEEERLDEIIDSLLTPVPTVTPRFPAAATSLPQVQPTAVPTQSMRPKSTAVLPQDPNPTETSLPSAQPTATYRPAIGPSATPSSPGSPNPRPKPDPDPKPKPTDPPAAPTAPPRPAEDPNPYPQPDPGGPTPNPYP
jgi:hypothetical protein